jgi:serine protease AprX
VGKVEGRGSALWGNGGGRKRQLFALVGIVAALAAVAGTSARTADAAKVTALVPKDLLAQAQANPSQLFDVIVQGSRGVLSNKVADELNVAQKNNPGVARGVYRRFTTVLSGIAATVTGKQLQWLSKSPFVSVITPDTKTTSSGLTNTQIWPQVAQLDAYWARADAGGTPAPSIAFLDSGIDASNPAFSGRVLDQENFYSGTNANSPGDGLGHGTFSAGIAAGAVDGHAGGTPDAGIVELDVLDDQGSGSTSDMIAALEWVQQHKAQYNIGVVNISVVGSQNSSFMYDPLDKAVEELWLNGVVVVASAGNYGTDSGPSGVPFAPANDPFVITVGATDTNGTVDTSDDFAAPWSAWGSTNDGFAKPELSAPGRYMIAPVPSGSTLTSLMPDRVTEPGYMWMSGTSFSAPVVSAAAAYVRAEHPAWTPDQVKGALMVSAADSAGYNGTGAMGVGEVQASAAVATDGTANPNLGLDRFLTSDPATGLSTFDSDTWLTTAQNDPTWNAMSWASMSWASMSWASMSWASMSWASQTFASSSSVK